MGTETAERKQKTAMCCGTPLISTMVFNGAEFYCRKCGSKYGMFGAFATAESTPELDVESEANQEWFYEIMSDYITPRSRRIDCEKCDKGEDHLLHATPEQLKASDAALEKLKEAVGDEA